MSETPRYGTNTSNTSKFMTDLLNEFNKMPKGVFNLTRRKIQDVTPYSIVPFESWEMLPNSDLYIKYDIQMLSKTPTLKRMLSGMKAEIRVYKVNYNDCWEGWNNFITKGRSGRVEKSIPYVDLTLGTDNYTTSLPYCPMEYLRHAPAVFLASGGTGDVNKFSFTYNTFAQPSTGIQSSGKTGISTISALKASTAMRISALPYVAYNKIVKQFLPSNLLQNNPHWYPENENHDMILPYSASGAVTTSDFDNPTHVYDPSTDYLQPNQINIGTDEAPNYSSYPFLNILQFAQRKGDYFNTGSPFPDLIRGDIPTIEAISAHINWDNVVANSNAPMLVGGDSNGLGLIKSNTQWPMSTNLILAMGSDLGDTSYLTHLRTAANEGNLPLHFDQYLSAYGADLKAILSKATLEGLNFSMSQWRYLATMTVLRERMALTDGSYNSMIKAMFGHNPMWHNHEPTYCGGTTQPIVFSEVVNTTESATAPLGDVAGRAVSSANHDIIHVHSDDYAVMMAVMVITPDTYYSQGVDKMWSRLENAEQYLPILNNLSPDATKNKELFVSGTNATDEDVFNYQERFAYYKSRRNEVSGLLSLAVSKIGDIGAWVMQRLFSDTPAFNVDFNRGKLTDNEKSVFATVDQAEFNVVVGSNMRFIAPIPEDSRPSDMGISY